MSLSMCPSCRQYEVSIITAPCGRRVYYCSNCDYGINECTEDVCEHERVKGELHHIKTDIQWMGSGRDGDPWVMTSWDVEPCDCNRPWRHAHLA